MMKEALRSIYSVAQNVSQAEDALLRWVKAAQKIRFFCTLFKKGNIWNQYSQVPIRKIGNKKTIS